MFYKYYQFFKLFNNMSYTAKYFRESMPEWKRKKDCLMCQYTFRPWSFYLSAWLANIGVSANTVSFASVFVSIIAALCFLFDNYWCHVAGGIMFNVWYMMDTIDGNLARSIRKQPFGAFADSMSSYVLVALMGAPIGYAVYCKGGLFVEPGVVWMIVMGSFASMGDTLMRLVYQKYKATERELQDKGVLNVEYDQRIDEKASTSLLVIVEESLGVGGYLCIFVLLASIFEALDIIVAYIFIYYGGSCILMLAKYAKKAIKAANEYGDKMPQ